PRIAELTFKASRYIVSYRRGSAGNDGGGHDARTRTGTRTPPRARAPRASGAASPSPQPGLRAVDAAPARRVRPATGAAPGPAGRRSDRHPDAARREAGAR